MTIKLGLLVMWKCKNENCETYWGIDEGYASYDVYRTECPECGTVHTYAENVGKYMIADDLQVTAFHARQRGGRK